MENYHFETNNVGADRPPFRPVPFNPGIILAIASLLITIASLFPIHSLSAFSDTESISLYYTTIAIIGGAVSVSLFFILAAYLKNFRLKNINTYILAYIFIIVTLILGNNISEIKGVKIVSLLCILSVIAIEIAIGTKLIAYKNDYVGGLKLLGTSFILTAASSTTLIVFYITPLVASQEALIEIYSSPPMKLFLLVARALSFITKLLFVISFINVMMSGYKYYQKELHK